MEINQLFPYLVQYCINRGEGTVEHTYKSLNHCIIMLATMHDKLTMHAEVTCMMYHTMPLKTEDNRAQ